MIDKKLNTWSGLNVKLIDKAYEEIAPKVQYRMCNKETRKIIREMMKEKLPEYDITCDESNNPPDVIDSGNVLVRVSKYIHDEYKYVDVIF
jgi:predicted HicB family RNase H-like nuclease